MIYSAILYSGEKALLRIRCEELKRLNVIHVLVESTFTFTGKSKPLYFAQHKDEFKDYPIIHLTLNEVPHPDPWQNEIQQRDYCMTALQGLNDNDIVIISDCDEIPRASSIEQYKIEFGPVALQQDMMYYYLNIMSQKGEWNIAKMAPWSYLKNTTPNALRNQGVPLALMDGGWHFAYTGGVAGIMNKLSSFSHQDEGVQRLANPSLLQGKMDRIESPWGPNKLTVVPIVDLPVFVQEHQEEYKEMIYVNS